LEVVFDEKTLVWKMLEREHGLTSPSEGNLQKYLERLQDMMQDE
jgi:hypothetical protein